MSQQHGRYEEAGVDIAAGEALVRKIGPLARSTARAGVTAGLGGFGAVFDLAACGFRDPLLVAGTDGVGTKVLLGIESGRLRGLGVDLVAMCVNDLVVQAAQPLFFLDYYATSRLDVSATAEVLEGIAEGCREAGCALIGGETAEMPGLYAPGHFDLAGFAVGAVERASLLPRVGAVRPGDVILGLPSSGLHSNGFSLVRLVLRESAAALDDAFDNSSLAEALLTPTRIYVRGCLAAAEAGGVHAMAHITGGGLSENLPRVLPEDVVARLDASRWQLPPVIEWVARTGGVTAMELARTLNAGIGMTMIVDPASVPAVEAALRAAGEHPIAIGEIVPGNGPARVEIVGTETWPNAPSRS